VALSGNTRHADDHDVAATTCYQVAADTPLTDRRYNERLERTRRLATSICSCVGEPLKRNVSWLAQNMSTKILKNDPSELGQNLFYGLSVRRNYQKAFSFLLEAANRGDVHTQNLVGYCYDLGLGVKSDKALALFWYRQAARFNHREALYNLALKYEKGEGVVVNHRKAFSLYGKGAELGDALAQCALAIGYLEGLGTKQDLSNGIEWMRKAARRGDAIAQYNLGMAYLNGEGVKVNRRHARVWLGKASKQGYKRAKAAIRRAS
jgi:uncharacterized protein